MPCISLETGRTAAAQKAHLHLHTDMYRVTSDVPPEGLCDCDVLERTLPGVLGCYFFRAMRC